MSDPKPGNWIAATPIPDQSLETREKHLTGKDQELLLAFARKILCWLPDGRAAAQDIFEDEYIMQYTLKDQGGTP